MNVYDVINSRILELLEKGTVPWKRGWNVNSSMPMSLATKKEYRGINTFILACQEYSNPYWLTYNQINERGGFVKKGMKASPIVFWKWIDSNNPEDKQKVPLLRYYNVYNVLGQTEGIEVPEIETTTNTFTPIEKAEQIITNMPDKPLIQHMGNRAYYNHLSDTVTLPPQQNFQTAEEYYCTAFHELIHSTMAENRLNRKATIQVHKFGDEHYSKEELVAEMGASFLCGYSGIVNTLENSVSYISGWLKSLKNDRTLLVHAAAQAQRASDYILNVQPDAQEAS